MAVARDACTQTACERSLKADFPLLRDSADGQSLHYLDSAATTQTPGAVIDALHDCYRNRHAPIHRGLYALAEAATRDYEAARATVARFIQAPSPRQLIFTRSATEAINMVAHGWLRARLKRGDRVWVTRMEHHANFLPWQRLCQECGAELRIIELDDTGRLEWHWDELLDRRTRLIAITHVSNVLGVENALDTLCRRAAAEGVPVLVDAAQSVGHRPIDVSAMQCDFLAFSAHKMYGPGGIGALYARAEHLESMEPLLVGGGMVDRVERESSVWADVPARFEAGSPNLAGALGFAAAVDYLCGIGMDTVHRQVSVLTRAAVEALAGVPGIRLYPQPHLPRSTIVSFTLAGIHPHDIAHIAGEHGVALRAGHHCCQPLMHSLGVNATVRASFGVYNDADDVRALIDALQATRRLLG